MKISSDYPGGNIKVLGIDDTQESITKIYLEQDLSDTQKWWFYWNFKIEQPPKGIVEFHFLNGNVISPRGPATSHDGTSWFFCEDAFESHKCFKYTFEQNEDFRFFAFSIPYQVSDFEKFYNKIANIDSVKLDTFTVSESGRPLPLLTFGNGVKDIIFTARHHCCESTASYVLEGVISEFLFNYSDLLKDYRFHVIPFVDIDGVENGDQGKDRIPHDHNRDYIDNPIYNYTKAMYEYVKRLNVCTFFDFHSPWKWGGADDAPHIHLSAEKEINLQNKFVKQLQLITEKSSDTSIIFDGYTTSYGSPSNLVSSHSAKNFFSLKVNAELSLSIETPYSGNRVTPYNVDMLHKWGQNIAKALYITLH